MRLCVELVTDSSVRGWAVNDLDYAERLRIQVWTNGELFGETIADIFRQDLLDNHLGDGRYGFEQAVNSDLFLCGVRETAIEVRGFLLNGQQVNTIVVEGALNPIKTRIAIPELAHVMARISGSCFFADNVNSFNKVLEVDPNCYPLAANSREVLAIRIYRFGDFMWWSNPEREGPPTATRLISHIGPRTKERLAKGEAKLLFDMSNEGPAPHHNGFWLSLLHNDLRAQGIMPSSCVILNHNFAFREDYLLWCRENDEPDPMNVLIYHFYIAKFAYLTASRSLVPLPPDPSINHDEYRTFVCLNFTPRQDRVAFLAWLFGAGLADRGFISFAGFTNHKLDGSASILPDWLPEMDMAKAGMEQLKSIGQLLLDLPEVTGNHTPEFDLGPEHCFTRSFFSIVTESEFSDGSVLRITEKSLKPLAMGHPIIIYGNPHSLDRLRELGFRTFSPFIDELYDTIDDRHERMTRVQAEVRRLVGMSPSELLELRAKLRRVIEHNYRHARGGLSDLYRSIIEPGILQELDKLSWRAGAKVWDR